MFVIIMNENSLSNPTKPVTSIADDINENICLFKIGLCVLMSYHVDVCSRYIEFLKINNIKVSTIIHTITLDLLILLFLVLNGQ